MALLFGLLLSLAAVAGADSLDVTDSLRDIEPLPLWSDSTLASADSLVGQGGFASQWLWPLGVILVTGTAAWLLFSVRSR